MLRYDHRKERPGFSGRRSFSALRVLTTCTGRVVVRCRIGRRVAVSGGSPFTQEDETVTWQN